MPSNNDRELKLPGYMDGKGRTKAAPQPKPDRKPNTAQKTKHLSLIHISEPTRPY